MMYITENDIELRHVIWREFFPNMHKRQFYFAPKSGSINGYTYKEGDAIVNEIGAPQEETWVVDRSIFNATYSYNTPECVCYKTAPIKVYPLWCLPSMIDRTECKVTTREGVVEIIDPSLYYLAMGEDGEVWPIEVKKVEDTYNVKTSVPLI